MGFNSWSGQFRSHKRASSTTATSGRTSRTKNSRTWRIQAPKASKDMKLKTISNPGGHKEGRASFPTQSSYKNSIIHPKNPREGEGVTEEKRGGRSGYRREEACVSFLGKQPRLLQASPLSYPPSLPTQRLKYP